MDWESVNEIRDNSPKMKMKRGTNGGSHADNDDECRDGGHFVGDMVVAC
jgi:hypothetical protein